MANNFEPGDVAVSSESQSEATKKPSTISSASLDLLNEGRSLNLSSSNNTADQYLGELTIDMENTASSEDGIAAGAALGELIKHNDVDNELNIEAHNSVTEPPADSATSTYSTNNELLSVTELREVTESLFPRLDQEPDGYLTRAELATAVEEPSYKGQEAQALAALYQNVNLKVFHDDQPSQRTTKGVTLNDMAEFDKQVTEHNDENALINTISTWTWESNTFFDADENQKLSREEIQAHLSSENLTPQDEVMLSYLENNFDGMAGDAFEKIGDKYVLVRDTEEFARDKGISKQDINQFMSEKRVFSLIGTTDMAVKSMLKRTFEAQSQDASGALFADTENPALSVTPDAIAQGRIGDCYFLAALSAVAQSNPQSIVDMIDDNGDGTFTVTFPGASKGQQPITVTAPTDAELGMFNKGHESGTWATVLEKAYGQYRILYEGEGGLTDAEGAGNGGLPKNALKTLTGNNFKSAYIDNLSEDHLVEVLSNNLRDDKPVTAVVSALKTAGSSSDRNGSDSNSSTYGSSKFENKWTDFGFRRNHAYTIAGIKPDGEGGHLITVSNPWNTGDGTTSGTIDLTVEQFRTDFDYVDLQIKTLQTKQR